MLDINWQPSRRELRLFGALWTPLFLIIAGTYLLYRHGQASQPTVIGLCVAATLSALLGSIAPGVLRPVYLALMVVTYPLGWILSHLILFTIFFGVVTPLGLLMRAVGRDPLHRKFIRSARTYWTPHISPPDKSRYFRQY